MQNDEQFLSSEDRDDGQYFGSEEMLDEQFLKPGEKIDDLQRSGLKIIQDPARFCFGMDAVLLTGFVQDGIGERSVAREDLLDLGTGTGIIPLLMSAKSDCRLLTGLEIQPDSAEMAQRSVKLNRLEERIRIVQGDIKEADALFAPASFGLITCNPPYMIGGHGLQNPDSPKAIARHEVLCDFEDVARAAERLLKSGGHFYLVHRPFRLAEIICVQAFPAGGDHLCAEGARAGAQAHAAGLSLCGPGAQHGSAGLRPWRQAAPAGGEAADRLQSTG